MATIKIFNPDGLNRPRSPYMQVARVAPQELAFIAGQVSVDASGNLIGQDNFEAQCVQVFANIHQALGSVGADWKNVVEFTSYLVRAQDVTEFTAFRRRLYPEMFPSGEYPPNTLLVINRLAHESYLLEIQTVAAL
jgi:enamine deaminase RidA (YjgF/YER057c/UK114 family)